MTSRSLTPILLVCAAAGVACADESSLEQPPFEPEPAPVFTTLDIRPSVAELFTVPPGNVVVLSVWAWDETGAQMPVTGAASYSSSAPAIAEVSSDGLLTGAAPGTGVITATLTLGGITRSASMTATVRAHDEIPGASPEIGGVYDLTGQITGSDPVWGIEPGTRQTSVLTIQPSGGSPVFSGTFAGFCAIDSSGESCNPSPGFVSGVIHPDGAVVIELTFEGSQSSYFYGEGLLAGGQIAGTYGAGGHISGTFTAERREGGPSS